MAWWQPHPQLVVLTSTADSLLCVHLTGAYPALNLAHYQKISLAPGIMRGLLLCNPTRWRQVLRQMLTSANLQLLPIGLILAHEQMVEAVAEQDLDYQFLQITGYGPQANQAPYRAGISAAVLLQYQLVFTSEQYTLLGVTTKNGALLGLTTLPQFSWTGSLPELVRWQAADTAATELRAASLVQNQTAQPLDALAYQELLPSVGLYQYWSRNEAD